MKKIIFSTLISTVILFMWSGATQMFPWGVPSTQIVTTQSDDKTKYENPRMIELPPYSLTTEKFDPQFVNKISTLTTDDTFSWIISTPAGKNSMGVYFAREVLTQLAVALLLAIFLLMTVKLDLKTRLGLVLLFGVTTVAATYGQLMNWWGLPAMYALGAGFNLVVGWMLATWVSAKWVIR